MKNSQRKMKVEPPFWWVGMKTPLQIMLMGKLVGTYNAYFKDAGGIRVASVNTADSPDYLFVDVEIDEGAEAGEYTLVLSKAGADDVEIAYQFRKRDPSRERKESFGTADLIYLVMPDRFPGSEALPAEGMREQIDRDAYFGRHGGSIRGIRHQLDYIEDLGATALWCTPLLEDDEPRESYHGYACTDYYRIDPRFGSNEEYLELVDEAHARGLKMIMDVVTNHCGAHHWWIENLPFRDWVNTWDSYTHSNCCFSTQNDPYASELDHRSMVAGWFDRNMPDMNLDNPFVLQYFKQWAVWWIEYAGLDGLRIDTYPYNSKLPMAQWCEAVRREYPWINMVGEVWTGNVPQLAYWQEGNANRDGFDSHLPCIMDFPLQSAISQALARDTVFWDEGMVKIYDAMANDTWYRNPSQMLIFAGNHDTERIADVHRRSIGRQKIVMALLATLRGIPQLLYADELMAVSRDRSKGHGALRIDFPSDWRDDAASREVHDYARALFRWRKTATAVHNGKTMHFLRRDNSYAYFRYNSEQTVFVFINNSRKNMFVPWEDYAEVAGDRKQGRDVVTGELVDFSSPVKVRPRSALVVTLL